jgi:hypothetical protein
MSGYERANSMVGLLALILSGRLLQRLLCRGGRLACQQVFWVGQASQASKRCVCESQRIGARFFHLRIWLLYCWLEVKKLFEKGLSGLFAELFAQSALEMN